ncbi:SUKH-4 family immunity protein [Streptomyces diastatochromogenes]|uniref:SUKH-4 immunity protein n=1 Tax=Streptomyces diastatochromogenes TaxID=42236 RepID=A0A233SM76_STRDA|nr:SUKH-4 family immunity protein [Streptomyces diastatochromogenes]MCZ0986317.1 SUKH-4 family immunity protein [Streptomyces diastatochromogenes]OXY96689.1 hypothetical protein BEK98_10730 [Streptomyces diastatochromogenes]
MDDREPDLEVERLLHADLGVLLGGEDLSVRPSAVLDVWRIPDDAKEALSVYGLPAVPADDSFVRVGASFQPGKEPAYAGHGTEGYVIGSCGDVSIVADVSVGSVYAVPEVREMVPALSHLHPDGVPDALINSRVVDLVDFSWRWYWLAPLLVEQRDLADQAEMDAWRSGGPDVDFHAPYRRLCSKVRDSFRAKDRAATSTDDSMWSVMIDGFE